MSKTYRGQCLCGQIAYEVKQIEPRMGHCHCTMCRKFHGAAFATLGEAKTENFRWIRGEELLKSYTGSNGTVRQFCRHCGSSMTFEAAQSSGELVEFAMGTLDSDVDVRPDVHIFTEFGADWYDIADDLPVFRHGRE